MSLTKPLKSPLSSAAHYRATTAFPRARTSPASALLSSSSPWPISSKWEYSARRCRTRSAIGACRRAVRRLARIAFMAATGTYCEGDDEMVAEAGRRRAGGGCGGPKGRCRKVGGEHKPAASPPSDSHFQRTPLSQNTRQSRRGAKTTHTHTLTHTHSLF